MNRQETVAVMAVFSAAFPHATLTDATVELWIEQMGNVDPQAAHKAANRIVREDEKFPTIARFLAMTRACTPSEIVKALPAPTITAEEQIANVAKVKEMLAQTTRKAW